MDGGDGRKFRPVLYVSGVVGLAGLTIGSLAGLYVSRVPEFTRAFVEDPVSASREDPVAIALILGSLLATVLLVGLIVGFGVRYGPEPDK